MKWLSSTTRACLLTLFFILVSGALPGSLADSPVIQGQCLAVEADGKCKEGNDKEGVPTRSGLYESNLILDGEVNQFGQREISNSVKVWFTLHPNGDGLDEGIHIESKDYSHIDEVIEKYCCDLMKVEKSRCAPASGARLVTETGVRMLSFNDVEDGQRVYCVPQGLHFVWPMKKTGYTVYPKNVVGPKGKPIVLRQLTERPRVFAVDNFVSDEEIEEILTINAERMEPSEVGFGGWQDDTRTSHTSWDDISNASRTIRTRTFQLLAMDEDPEMADALQVLRYRDKGKDGKGEWYKPHVDWFGPEAYDGHDPTVNNGTNRFATMFLYLSDVEEGGATVFPLSTTHEGYNGEKLVHDGTVDVPGYISAVDARYCCNESSTALRSKPVKGNAVLFYSQGPDGTLDPYSLHGGCPPIKGVKWSANFWIWNRKSPDKSMAKDKPPSDESGGTISFANARDVPLDLYWDSASASSDYEGLPSDINEIQLIFDSEPSRFHFQLPILARQETELHSYQGHAFIAVEKKTNKVVWSGTVKKYGDIMEIM